MYDRYLKIAFRNIVRYKGYSFINIAGLAVGLAFAILILLWVQYETSVDRFHDDLDRLHLVAFTVEAEDFHGEYTVGALAPYLKSEYPEITHATRITSAPTLPFEHNGEEFRSYGSFVDPDFLQMFSFPLVQGDPETALAEPLSVVITQRLAQRVFGDEHAVGKPLKVSEQLTLTVGGVMKDLPNNTTFDFEYLLNCAVSPSRFDKWDVKSLVTYVKLADGADASLVGGKIQDVYNDHNPGAFRNDHYLFPLRDFYLYGLSGGGKSVYVFIFSALAAAVLFIACVNFINLSTARAATRSREIGIKKTVGAGRPQLIAQFLIESFIVTGVALVLAVGAVELLLPAINMIAGSRVELVFSPQNILGLLGLAVLTGLIAGGYPAFYLSALRPVSVLTGQGTSFGLSFADRGRRPGWLRGGSGLRRILVVAQFSVSIALIVSVLVIVGQLNHIRNMDIGFNKDHVVIFNLPRELASRTSTVKTELLNHTGVENVTVSTHSLVKWQSSFGIDWEGKLVDKVFDVGFTRVDHDYLETFQMEMAAGRFFSREFPSDIENAYIVNEAAVRAMEIEDPVGKRITIAPGSSLETPGVIVGVIRDYHTESAHKQVRPFILGMTEHGNYIYVRTSPDNTASTVRAVRSIIAGMAPGANVWFRFYDEEAGQLYQAEIMTGAVVAFVMAIAIFISCLGLFGLAAYTAERRTKEIGIRKTMGASVSSVVGLMSREFLLLVVVSTLISCPVAWFAMNRWLENFAFRMTLGPGVFVLAAILALTIAMVTVTYQALKLARLNPAQSLRYE